MKKISLFIVLILTACAASQQSYEAYLNKRGLHAPTPDSLYVCRGYGCQYHDRIEMTASDWKQINKIFAKKAKSAQDERAKVAKAIGAFEKIVGGKNGSYVDIAGTFEKTGTYQLDCVDESTNTTVYLAALERKGALKYHTLLPPTVRFPLVHSGTWPHQTAVLKENSSNETFAVDSWFHDNGAPAEIVELNQWKDGWRPEVRE